MTGGIRILLPAFDDAWRAPARTRFQRSAGLTASSSSSPGGDAAAFSCSSRCCRANRSWSSRLSTSVRCSCSRTRSLGMYGFRSAIHLPSFIPALVLGAGTSLPRRTDGHPGAECSPRERRHPSVSGPEPLPGLFDCRSDADQGAASSPSRERRGMLRGLGRPFRALECRECRQSQGVALGYDGSALQAFQTVNGAPKSLIRRGGAGRGPSSCKQRPRDLLSGARDRALLRLHRAAADRREWVTTSGPENQIALQRLPHSSSGTMPARTSDSQPPWAFTSVTTRRSSS